MEATKILRLKTGEDIICSVSPSSMGGVVLKNPMVVFTKMDLRAAKQLILINPWLPFHIIENNEVILNSSEILFSMDPIPEFIDYYKIALKDHTDALEEDTEEGLSQEDMKTILESVDTNNQMH